MKQITLDFVTTQPCKKHDVHIPLVSENRGESLNDSELKKTSNNNGVTLSPYRHEKLPAIYPDALSLFRFTEKTAVKETKLVIPKNVTLSDQEPDNPYIRVGCTYYKIIYKKDRYGLRRKVYKVWKKEEIKQDHGKEFLKSIPVYDDFTVVPDNINYQHEIGSFINLYSEFDHTPRKGEWLWTERLLRHIFGDQYELGLRYLQILYLYPNRSTVILALVSKERSTGKTTFINWLNMIFGANMVILSSMDFSGSFNSYAKKNIIAIEETFLEKRSVIEKLKALATAKSIRVNEKFVNEYMIPFFGKIILTSNNVDRFVLIEKEEIRFFVRELSKPEYENHAIENDLKLEIPAFLNHLKSLPPVDWSVSRSGFTPEELNNLFLRAVVEESASSLAKDLKMELIDFFDNYDSDEARATPRDIKARFFSGNSKYTLNYIRNVLKEEIGMIPTKTPERYKPFDEMISTRTGRFYVFKRDDFVTNTDDVTNRNL
jgi:hypothetical protein